VLLRTMLGLQKPVSGSVRIEGAEITGRPDRELLAVKRRYGVMFQRGALFSSLSVAQNVELPIREHFPMPDETLAELALLRIRMVGLAGADAAKYPAQLSGGMTSRRPASTRSRPRPSTG
jgi:phospholipid/cholesterol/gamma-HCH transport system ATP-binding protein